MYGHIRPLPARAALLPGESLTSLVRRTAEAMGYERLYLLLRMLDDSGRAAAQLNDLVLGTKLDRLAALLAQSPSELLRHTVHGFADRLVLLPAGAEALPELCDFKTILKYFRLAASPVCPCCLSDDVIPHERLSWSLRAVRVCPAHRCFLVSQCDKCRRSLLPGRNCTLKCGCGRRLDEIRPTLAPPDALALASDLDCWFRGERLPHLNMPTAATLWWAERLAVAAARTPTWLEQLGTRLGLEPVSHRDWLAWLAAADMLQAWPTRMEEFLDQYQRVVKHDTSRTGVTRRFGLLLRHACDLEELGYPEPADALRNYLLRTYRGGHMTSKVCLFQTEKHHKLLTSRAWIGLTEAANLLKLTPRTVAQLVSRGALEGQIYRSDDQDRSIGLVSLASVNALKEALRDTLTLRQAARDLGVGPHAVAQFIRVGELPHAVRTQHGWRIARSSVQKLLDVYRRLPPVKKRGPGWLPLREAARRFGPSGATVVQLLIFVRTGKIAAARTAEPDDLRGLHVWVRDIHKNLPVIRSLQDQVRGYPLNRLAKVLLPNRPTKERVLKRWIEMGLLRAERCGRGTFVSPEEVERFRAEYCLPAEACRLLRVSRSTLVRWRAAGRLMPADGWPVTPDSRLSLYRRSDVERLAAARRDRAA